MGLFIVSMDIWIVFVILPQARHVGREIPLSSDKSSNKEPGVAYCDYLTLHPPEYKLASPLAEIVYNVLFLSQCPCSSWISNNLSPNNPVREFIVILLQAMVIDSVSKNKSWTSGILVEFHFKFHICSERAHFLTEILWNLVLEFRAYKSHRKVMDLL